MRLETVRAGMKAVSFFDNGSEIPDVSVYEVLKLGRVKAKVRDELGNESWLYPEVFDREISEECYSNLMDKVRPSWRYDATGAPLGLVP